MLLTFESLDLESSVLVCGYVFGISRSSSYGSRSLGQGHGSKCVSLFVGGLPTIERQSCFKPLCEFL